MSTSLREHLQHIYDERGTLTAPLVVDEARNPDHPLHTRFEWDDSLAGERYREVQARELIRSVRVVYREGTKRRPEGSVRAFQHIKREDESTYIPTDKVAEDPFLTQLVLADMKREWNTLKARYGHFAEFVEMVRTDEAVAS